MRVCDDYYLTRNDPLTVYLVPIKNKNNYEYISVIRNIINTVTFSPYVCLGFR